MRVLALNPFHGGSHRAFIDGWMRHSRHDFTLLTLPACHWKWRMRQAAIHFARLLREPDYSQQAWDVLWVTDMLNLAELRGLCNSRIRQLPVVMYFHENQLTYPSRLTEDERQRDLHFGMANIISALAADEVWWNSNFHRGEFLTAVHRLHRHMPDHSLSFASEAINGTSQVCPPGVDSFPERCETTQGSVPHILWAARWEHDKQPELFFDAIDKLDADGLTFELSVIGQSYRDTPACFAEAYERHRDRIRHWGFLESRDAYRAALMSADIYVSTAAHEFFGITTVEAITAGCYPLLPNRLSYPELIENRPEYLYDYERALSDRLRELITIFGEQNALVERAAPARKAAARFLWSRIVPTMDDQLERLIR